MKPGTLFAHKTAHDGVQLLECQDSGNRALGMAFRPENARTPVCPLAADELARCVEGGAAHLAMCPLSKVIYRKPAVQLAVGALEIMAHTKQSLTHQIGKYGFGSQPFFVRALFDTEIGILREFDARGCRRSWRSAAARCVC